MTQTGVVGGGVLTDWVSLGVLASSVPRDVVDDAVAAAGKGARRSGGKLPPHVVVYFVMAMALFADDDYEEVAARLTQTLQRWGCWAAEWEAPTRGGITQARQRLGPEPMAEIFAQVAEPVAGLDTIGAFFGPWRLMSVDGMEWDVPDSEANRAAFGSRGGSEGPGAYPKVRVVTVSECASHAAVLAAMGPAAGGKGGGEQSLARPLLRRLQEDCLLIADRNFFCFKDWCAAADTGAALSEADNPAARVPKPRRLPSVRMALPDGRLSEITTVAASTGNDPALDSLLIRLHVETACRRGGALSLTPEDLDPEQCLIRLREKGGTERWQPVSPTLMAHLLAHAETRGGLDSGKRLLRYATGKPITSRRYDYLWDRMGEHLPWVKTQQVSMHWIRHTILTWVERRFGFAVAQAYAGHRDTNRGARAMSSTGTYVRAGLPEVATALSVLTGEPHPLAPEGARTGVNHS